LNVDETDDVEKVWGNIAKKLSIDVKELKEKILPLAAIYSIGEHSRAALVALNDNALPSNVGGGYNLRIILRSALGFIDDYGWDIDLADLSEKHAKFLKPMYPELSEKLDNVAVILENEKKKFFENKKRSKQIIVNLLAKKKNPKIEDLTEIYDSHGVRPEQVKKEASFKGVKIDIPDDFYSLVAEKHEQTEHKVATKKAALLNLENVPETKILYYSDWSLVEFEGKVVYSKDDLVALDQTAFYPTSGGQIHDIGEMNSVQVVDVFKQDGVVLHKLEKNGLKVGDKVKGKIDFERRQQLMQHHSSAHLVNLCSYEILGPHVWQAGASKTLEKGRLDITHYESLSEKQLKQIEDCCNEKIKKNLRVKSEIIPREVAEEKYGMHIYQGGFIPGKNLRIVTIGNDVEACGGTHANSLGDLKQLKILNSTKVQDGIIRINYTAGKAAQKEESNVSELLKEVAGLLGVKESQVPKRTEELFAKWKAGRKAVKKGSKADLSLTSTQQSKGTPDELLTIAAKAFSTQPEHLPRTIKRFLNDLESFKKKL
ncbi:alanine--tRNA ligase, partial [archaeon]|nr:alanine--tRNA ligase [archaeon]